MEAETKLLSELRGWYDRDGRVFWTSDGMSYIVTGPTLAVARKNPNVNEVRLVERTDIQLSGSDPGKDALRVASIEGTESELLFQVNIEDGDDFYLTGTDVATLLK